MSEQQRTIVVTGASRGIGRATALRLARDGNHVLAVYRSDDAGAASLVAQAAGEGRNITSLKADLANPPAIEALAMTIRNCARTGLDGIVHNAGVLTVDAFADTKLQDLDRLYAVNMRAPFLLTQHLAGHLNASASIMFISSVVAQRYYDGMAAYGMSKAAVEGLAAQLAGDLGPRGVRVNVIAPGAIRTAMQPRLDQPAVIESVLARQALKRIGEAEDVADAVAMLMSEDARWVTGTVITVSGGTKI